MENLLPIFLIIPLVGFLLTILLSDKNENHISLTALITTGFQLFSGVAFMIFWLIKGHPILNIKEITLYKSDSYSFFIDLYFDKVTAAYLFMSSLLTYQISLYSKHYMHKEPAFKRFFNTTLLFFFGIQVIIFSGNFETLFLGWEILGVSSFLLIAFYRDRYLPVKNAIKVFSIYRVADIGILLVMWLSHHLWHQNITFLQLNNSDLVHAHIAEFPIIGLVIAMAIVVAAMAKSAQFPFSSWLPRAMEGPTPSSSIFYGSIAVHIGVFLMLRTYPYWESLFWVKVFVILISLITSVLATVSARTQSSIKAQIAYSSIAQIGIIFIEVALGLHWIAILHMISNAFLRAYQLLVSPSTVTYLIREQFYTFKPHRDIKQANWKKVITNSLFVMGLKEWKLDSLMYKILWRPLKRIGLKLSFITVKNSLFVSVPVFLVFITRLYMHGKVTPFLLPELFSAIATLLVIKSFTERKNPFLAFLLVILSHFWIAMAVGLNETCSLWHLFFYLSGVVVAGIAGLIILKVLANKEVFDLNDFYGYSLKYKKMAFYFLLSCLALAGFPITTTFLGEDLMFTHIHTNQILLALFVSVSFIVEGLALIRIYARIFLGPQKKGNNPVALRGA